MNNREKKLMTVLRRANEACRSMLCIVKRQGRSTNWPAFQAALEETMKQQREVLIEERCGVCGARVDRHYADHLCRMHRDEAGVCQVCGKVKGALQQEAGDDEESTF